MARYRTYNPDQLLLIRPDIKDMISPESPVWMIVEIVNADMVRGLETSKSEEGNAAYNPLMMTRVLVWAYFNEVHSSRKIARKAWTDVEYMYICGMQHPDFRTICKFRKNNAEFLAGLYKKLYRAVYEMKLTKLDIISIDGSHFKANASGKKGCKRVKKWREIEKELDRKIADFEKKCDEIEREEDDTFGSGNSGGLPEEYRDARKRRKKIREVLDKLKDEDEKTKVNLTDPDARYLKKKANSNYTFGYNVGIAVDENHLIADVDMTNLSSDQQGLKAGIEGVEETIGGNIPEGTKVLCDAGYFSADNIDYLEKKKKLDGYIAPSMDFKTDEFEESWRRREFEYVTEEDALICRDCNRLVRHIPRKPPRKNIEQFKAEEDCRGCTFKEECCPRARHKFVSFMSGIESRTKMTDKMLGEESRKAYVKRKTTVEPTIGDIKENLGLRGFSVRGFACIVEAGLAALCHNIKRLANMTDVFAIKWRYA
jgi:transposase